MNYTFLHMPKTHPAINTFFDVEVKPKTLVMCDIDNTLLTWRKKWDEFVNEPYVASYFPFTNAQIIRDIKHRKYTEYCANTPPEPTDYHGFRDLDQRVERSGGELVFVTARWKESEQHTRTQLRMLGFRDNYRIHYTDGSHDKGSYITNNINTSRFNHCVFIDDLTQVLDTVKHQHPYVRCYRFISNT